MVTANTRCGARPPTTGTVKESQPVKEGRKARIVQWAAPPDGIGENNMESRRLPAGEGVAVGLRRSVRCGGEDGSVATRRRRGAAGPILALVALLLGAAPVGAEPPGTITQFPILSNPAGPQGLAAGPDGAEWFVEIDTGQIGRVTPFGAFTEFPTPGGSEAFLRDITAGPDGAMWFTDSGSCVNDDCDYLVNGHVGRITLRGEVTRYVVPSALGDPWNITAGPDGNLWFTEIGDYFNRLNPANVANIGRITPAGAITEFSVPTPASGPNGITVGPDGALWFTENVGNKIGRITIDGSITEFPIPTPDAAAIGIAAGTDGNLWFTEQLGQRIGRITPSGEITEFPLPAGGNPVRITSGPDRALWFTEVRGHRIGRIDTDGTITELPLASDVFPIGIANGPFGEDVYFGALGANIIGKVKVVAVFIGPWVPS